MYYDHIAFITTNPDTGFHQAKIAHIAGSIGVSPDDITVHHFERHGEGADRGCFSSHYYLWNFIANEGFERTLILEYDGVFLKNVRPDRFEKFLEANPDWDAFFFGHRPIIWDERFVRKTDTPGIVRVATNDTHAYILSKRGAEKMASVNWYGKAVDISVRENTDVNFALFPMRAIQCGTFFSDSFFNGMSERNSQYIRYATQKPFNLLRAVSYLGFLVAVQPWIFLSSTWFSLTQKHP
ncbi:MAG: hypothetical protein LAT57_10230 [Balneolales bacterium]|nr:hypothetical protein [Balneolales bacterium]